MDFANLDITLVITSVSILLVCGAIAGFLAGLLGVGGGIVFVPALYFVFMHAFHVSPDLAIMIATGTSLMCMIPTSITAAISQYKRGNTELLVIKKWAPFMILGVIAGTYISSTYGGQWLAAFFGCVMIINSINTLFRAKAKPLFASLPGTFGQGIIGFSIACFSVMLGVGGGTLTIPILNACSVEPHKSIGTSSAVSLFVCIPGAIMLVLTSQTPELAPMGTIGLVNVLGALCVIPLSVFFAPIGVRVGKNVSPVTLKRIFAVSLFIVSIRMLMSAF